MPEQVQASVVSSQREAIKSGVHFLLPIEVRALEARRNDLMRRQRELGSLLGDAMTESSETFHDNAPAEAINGESRNLHAEHAGVIHLLRTGERIDYPTAAGHVAIGSLVTLRYPAEEADEAVLLTGYTRNVLPEDLADLTGDAAASALSAESPIGLAMLGARPGDTVAYEANRRTFSVGVVSVASVIMPGNS